MGTTRNLILFSIAATFFHASVTLGQAAPPPKQISSVQSQAPKHAAPAAGQSPVAGQPAGASVAFPEKAVDAKAWDFSDEERTALYSGSGKGCTEANMAKVPISAISFVGFRYSGDAVCVPASNDRDAAAKCAAKSSSYTAVNPGNPQYGTAIKESRDGNSWGFYWCIKVSPTFEEFAEANNIPVSMLRQSGLRPDQLNDKAALCESVAPLLSTWGNQLGAPLAYRFSTQGSTDGDCQCRVVPDGEFQNCDREPPAGALTVRSEAPAAPAAVSTPVAADPNVVSAELTRCIERYTQQSLQCKEEAQRALASCDERNNNNTGNRNSGVNMAAGATEIMGQAYNMRNQASGMQAECFRAGAVANTASTAIRGMQEQCSRDSGRCQALCRGAEGRPREEEFKTVCAREAGKTPEQLESEGTANSDAFIRAAATIRENSTEGLNVCTNEVKRKSDTLSNLLSGVGRALQSSVQCACQTAAAGANCENIPSVQDCTAIPQPAGCGAYEAMATCSVGSASYNAKECQCMQNPASPGCGGGSNAISAFAGPGIANNLARGTPGGGVNFSGGAGGGKGSNFSIGANGEIENSDLSFLNGSKSGAAIANSVGGGGTPGAGGSSNGNASEDKGVPGMGEEEKGIGGIFSQAKTFMSNALGLGKKAPSKGEGNGGLGKQPDMGRFKPLRGLAGRASGMGSKNMDIWKMMNACTSGDTCKSNENNYLSTP